MKTEEEEDILGTTAEEFSGFMSGEDVFVTDSRTLDTAALGKLFMAHGLELKHWEVSSSGHNVVVRCRFFCGDGYFENIHRRQAIKQSIWKILPPIQTYDHWGHSEIKNNPPAVGEDTILFMLPPGWKVS